MAASNAVSSGGDSKPVIVLLSLKQHSFWDEMYAELIPKLNARATVVTLKDTEETKEYLTNHTITPSAIIATDEAVCTKKPNLTKRLKIYVENGGTLILATLFPSFVRPNNLKDWFEEMWNLPWETGNYHRANFSPNPSRLPSRLIDSKLPGVYSMKALFLKNVPPEAMVYKESPKDNESPVVFASIGKGWLGYIGDVNTEPQSGEILMAMCGI
ncbi:unnamed protein product [Bemisia tabaci]|uniref:Uncharacterized protein n=1 Tax=Bemisia tabaci TaxID=7038 RepID=A0A9P0ALX4_BEMTA|nr:unnamed protein product [Bemisia tabaci]